MKRKFLEGMLIGLAAALAALSIWRMGFLDRWEYATWAWRAQYFAGPGPSTDRIKLILLDQASLDWGKKQGLSWPWPREVYAPLIDFCSRHGAKAVIFDVIYSEPSPYAVSDDRALAEAVCRAPAFVGSLCLYSDGGYSTSWPEGISNRLSLRIENLEEFGGSRGKEIAMASASFPITEVASCATILGNVMETSDVDGVFRRVSLFRTFDGRVVPSLGLAAFGAGSPEVRNNPPGSPTRQECLGRIEAGRLEIGGRSIPLDSNGRMILRFRGPAGTYQSFNAADIIESELLAGAGAKETIQNTGSFKDAYVFFGFTAPGLLDLRPTPLSNVSPGTEIHATLLDNMLTGDFLRDPHWVTAALSTLLLALFTALAVVMLAKRAWHSVMAFSVLFPLPAALGFAFYPLGIWWPVIVQETAVLSALMGAIVVNYATEGRQKAFFRRAFSQYLSPAVIQRLVDDPSQLKLGGERRELTIFFSDLEGFSSFSERLPPDTLTRLLNDYLSDMTDIILDEGGTLDKYEGDAIIAFWNAPLAQPDHAERACRATLRCQQRLAGRREEFRNRTGTLLRARVGINTGEVTVGNMGSSKRFDYTVLGDAANLASRLEGANKAFGTYTMISEATWQKTNSKFAGRQIGLIRVVGRSNPVRVFEPRGDTTDADLAAVEQFERGLSLCFEKKWLEALKEFRNLPDDPVAVVYAEQCRKLLEDPSMDWDCVWNLTSK
ncbi:MAG: CHASE2 domain-containing protein [Syntrophobacteraceae bacterium]